MEIRLTISRQEIEMRLEEYVRSTVYNHWDHGMTLADSERDGADVPGLTESSRELPDLLRDAIYETYDEHFDEGFPNGCPPELADEIRAHVGSVVDRVWGPEEKKKPKKKVAKS